MMRMSLKPRTLKNCLDASDLFRQLTKFESVFKRELDVLLQQKGGYLKLMNRMKAVREFFQEFEMSAIVIGVKIEQGDQPCPPA